MSGPDMSASRGVTARELLQQLESDPAWLLERDQRQEALNEPAKARQRDEAPVVADLVAVGLKVSSLWELGSDVAGRTDVLAVLLRHLSRATYSDFTRGAIARSIAQTRITSAWPDLARRYGANPGPQEADGLALALVDCAAMDRLDDLLALLRDETHGESRVFMVRPVTRRLRGRGDDVLRELALDDQLAKEATSVLHEREVARLGRARRAQRSSS